MGRSSRKFWRERRSLRLSHSSPCETAAERSTAKWDVAQTEMYDESFHVPPPDAVVFEERWDQNEYFRSGGLWQIGKGRVFYFRSGHETYPVCKQAEPLRGIENAVRWLETEIK